MFVKSFWAFNREQVTMGECDLILSGGIFNIHSEPAITRD